MKRTLVDRIDVTADGSVMVRFAKQTLVDGNVSESAWHRTMFPPGTDVDQQMGFVNTHLVSMGCAPVASYPEIHAAAKVAHTPERIAAHKKAQEV